MATPLLLKYTLGLDLGIASVGWCVINTDQHRIEDLGVRTFTKAEQPKNGDPLAEARRLARGARRRIRRRAHRLERIRQLFSTFVDQPISHIEDLLFTPSRSCPYELRAQGLDRLLTPQEWLRVLYHIASRRGFQSNRKSETMDTKDDGGKLLAGVRENASLLSDKKYRTIGEMFYKDEKFTAHKRNKGGSYAHTIGRSYMLDEIHILFQAQQELNNPHATSEFEEKFCRVFSSQRPVAEKGQILKMVGYCTFENEKAGKESDQLRAPKLSYSAEKFQLLTKITNLRIIHLGSHTQLSPEQKEKIYNLAHKNVKVTYQQIRKELELAEVDRFNGLTYALNNKKDSEESTFIILEGYHKLKKAITNSIGQTGWFNFSASSDQLDSLAEALTYYKTDKDIKAFLSKKSIDPAIQEAILGLSFSKVIHLSLKALRNLLPHLEVGLRYDEACTEVGYLHYNPLHNVEKSFILPNIAGEITNPVVRRSLTQARKVINGIIRRYGSPHQIHIELARELNKPWDEREKIKKGQEEYRSQKEKAREKFIDLTHQEPRAHDLLKFRLWADQKGLCAYSQEPIDLGRLADDPTYTEVDHIIPYSRSFDDTMANKVLVKTFHNRQKGNRTPYEYLSPTQWEKFEVWVTSTLRGKKQQNLLLKNSDEGSLSEMKERHLTDTRYITRFLANFLQDHLLFRPDSTQKPVRTLNGQLTAFLRSRWGLIKNREESDLHHALDAAVIAAASGDFVKTISRYSKMRELHNTKTNDGIYVDPETGEIMTSPYRQGDPKKFPLPWDAFRDELVARLSPTAPEDIRKLHLATYPEEFEIRPVFVSRMPTRKGTGAAHQETIRSTRWIESGRTALKTSLTSLTLSNLEEMVGKERDYPLYNSLKARLEAFSGNGAKAFAGPFYKPTRDGTQGPPVHSIRLFASGESGVVVREGLAKNDNMIRVDVYFKDKKYYLVPIYVADLAKKVLPNRAITAAKPENEWPEMDLTYQFLFRLYPNDLVYIRTKKENLIGYYRGTDRGTGGIEIDAHDRNNSFGKNGSQRGIGVKNAFSFQKLSVDPLGRHSPILEVPEKLPLPPTGSEKPLSAQAKRLRPQASPDHDLA